MDKQIAYLILRLALGINIFIHGVGRFGVHFEKFVNETVALFTVSLLPLWGVTLFVKSTPFIEAIIGFLLIVGILTRYALVLGSAFMICLIIGMGLLNKWDIVGIQMIYVIFYFLLIFFLDLNRYSLDGWLILRAKKNQRIVKNKPA